MSIAYHLPPPEPWMQRALCPEIGADLFFIEDRDDGRAGSYPKAAHQACQLCPVQHECAEHAIENDEPAGLWGGLTPQRRRQIRRERGMG